jgi:hypothetical protein
MPISNRKKIEGKTEELNNIYFSYSKDLLILENKQISVIKDLEKKIKDEELKKIRNNVQ